MYYDNTSCLTKCHVTVSKAALWSISFNTIKSFGVPEYHLWCS